MPELLDKIERSDVLVLGTPIYFYNVDAQLKTVMDRCFSRYTESEIKGHIL
ncbi:MAG: NAD(P)H-dependent oxidoreductase [Rikenellaceae bacterium]|nr:NAD(P)H-dependent oxidoreductase [Rikenellaceae bacterium]